MDDRNISMLRKILRKGSYISILFLEINNKIKTYKHMGKIATKAFCNSLCPGAFSGDTTKCPTKSEIENVRIDVNGNGSDYAYLTVFQGSYSDNQLVQEEDIKYIWPEYTFSVSPSESVTLDATGDSQQYTVTSYKIYYSNTSGASRVEESQEEVEYSTYHSGDGSWNSGTNTVTVGANNTNTRPSGTITFTQNESEYQETRDYTQKEGAQNWGTITINSFTVDDISASGGCISSGTVTYTQQYGYGANNTGYTSTTGANVTYSTQVCGSDLDTTVTSRTRRGSITVTVSRGGETATRTVDVYQEANEETYLGRFDSTGWTYVCDISANPATVDWRSGSTSSISSTGYRYKGTEDRYSYTSGATRVDPIEGGEREDISVNLSISSGSSYASLNGSTLTFNENTSTSREREVVVYGELSGYPYEDTDSVTITQLQKSDKYTVYSLSCSESSLNFSESDFGSGNSQSFYVNSTAQDYWEDNNEPDGSSYSVPWSISISGSDTSYFTVSPTSGSDGDEVTVYPDSANYDTSDRGTMTIRVSNGGDSDNVSVTQSGYYIYDTEYRISISPGSYTFDKDGESKEFTVSAEEYNGNSIDGGHWSSTPWSVRDCTLGSYSVSGDSVYVNVDKNTGGARSGTLTVECDHDSSTIDSASLDQKTGRIEEWLGYQYEFSCSPTSLSFPASGGTKSVSVTSQRRSITKVTEGTTWYEEGPWSSVTFSSDTSGSGFSSNDESNSISVVASNNGTSNTRSGSLTISQSQTDAITSGEYASDTTPLTVSLEQSPGTVTVFTGNRYSFSCSPTSLSFPASGGTKSVSVTSRVAGITVTQTGSNYSVSQDSWSDTSYDGSVSGSGFSGSGNTAIASENTSTSKRNGTLILTQSQSDVFSPGDPGYDSSYASDSDTINVPLSQSGVPVPTIKYIYISFTVPSTDPLLVRVYITDTPSTTVHADISVAAIDLGGMVVGQTRTSVSFSPTDTSSKDISVSERSQEDPEITCHSISPSSYGDERYGWLG